MKETLTKLLAVVLVGTLLAVSSSSAQEDRVGRAWALVGTWEGIVDDPVPAADTNRTLVIVWVWPKDGKLVANGRYGITGKGSGQVDIEVEDTGDGIMIRFMTGANSRARLSLVGIEHLTGALKPAGPLPDLRMNLWKRK